MQITRTVLWLSLAFTVGAACGPVPAEQATSQPGIQQPDPAELLPNGRMPVAGVLTGGQPTAAELETLAELGYRTVINLRSPDESGSTDPAVVEALGMRYVSLPISGAEDIGEAGASRFAAVLDQAEHPVVVHCASGNRVGALFAMKSFYVDGETAEEALALGRAAGVTRLEPVVRELLGLE